MAELPFEWPCVSVFSYSLHLVMQVLDQLLQLGLRCRMNPEVLLDAAKGLHHASITDFEARKRSVALLTQLDQAAIHGKEQD